MLRVRSPITRRLLQAFPTLLGVTILAFVLVRLSGDPVATMLPPDASDQEIASFRAANGLDQPWIVQYFTFLGNALTGDLGTSIRYREPVLDMLLDRLGNTLELTMASLGLAVAVGLPLGLLAGLKRGSWIDKFSRTVAFAGQSIPSFYLGLILIMVFGVWLGALPTVGNKGPLSLILPTITLASALIPLILRVSRGSLLEVVRQDYIRTARAKGANERRVLRVHMLRNCMIPVLTIIGLQLGAALSGAVVTETVFAWPGIGRMLVDAIGTRDYPVVQAVVLFASVGFVVVNLAVDLFAARLDPRIRIS